MHADDKLTAFLELEPAICACGELPRESPTGPVRFVLRNCDGQFLQNKRQGRPSRKRSSRYQSYQGDKYATPNSTRGRIDDGPLRADHRRLFMLRWATAAAR